MLLITFIQNDVSLVVIVNVNTFKLLLVITQFYVFLVDATDEISFTCMHLIFTSPFIKSFIFIHLHHIITIIHKNNANIHLPTYPKTIFPTISLLTIPNNWSLIIFISGLLIYSVVIFHRPWMFYSLSVFIFISPIHNLFSHYHYPVLFHLSLAAIIPAAVYFKISVPFLNPGYFNWVNYSTGSSTSTYSLICSSPLNSKFGLGISLLFLHIFIYSLILRDLIHLRGCLNCWRCLDGMRHLGWFWNFLVS